MKITAICLIHVKVYTVFNNENAVGQPGVKVIKEELVMSSTVEDVGTICGVITKKHLNQLC